MNQLTEQKPVPPFSACPDCGCTDIEESAWVHINTQKPTGDDGPTDQVYCPQCGDAGYEGHMKWRHVVETSELCAFDSERILPEREGTT